MLIRNRCARAAAAAVATLLAASTVPGQLAPATQPAPLGAAPPATLPATPAAPILAATTAPARPATAPASQPAVAPFTLAFKDAPLDAVLEHLSEVAGFVVVKEGAVDGRVTLFSRQPITADEAVPLLNTVLKAQGYTAIRNGRELKIIARELAKKSNVPVYFGAEPADIEANEVLRTQVIPVGNVDAVKLRQDLSPLIGPDADVTANGGSNAIIITDTGSNIRRVVEIISALDRHEPGNAELRRYVLKNADATATAKLITALMKAGDQKQPEQPRKGEGGPDQALRGKVNAVADDRTNTLLVIAPVTTLKVIDDIIKDLDANPAAASEIRIFSLKFADATSAARLIAAVFQSEDTGPRRGGEEGPRPRDPSEQALHGRVIAAADDRTNTLVVTAPAPTLKIIEGILNKLDADPASTAEIKVFPLSFADATSASRLISSIFRPPDVQNPQERRRDGQPATVSARVNAVADDRTNSLVVTAPTDTLKAIEQILLVLDANPAATAEVKVVQLKHADAFSASSLLSSIFSPDPIRLLTGDPRPAHPSRGRLNTSSDSRTNTIVLQGPADVIASAEAVLRQLDENPATEETLFIYRLKNGQALRMEQTLNVLFGNTPPGLGNLGRLGLGGLQGGLGGRGSGFGRQGGNSRGGGGPFGQGNRRGGLSGDSFGGQGQGIGQAFQQQGGMNPAIAQALQARGIQVPGNGQQPGLSPGSTRALSELSGQVFVVADEDTNSLLVTTSTKYLTEVKAIIAELDRPVPQVLIKVLVAEVTHDDATDVGVDFSVLNRRANGNGQSGGTDFGLTGPNAATGGLVVQLLEANVNATLRALASQGKLDVLSRPYILASDNQLAAITVGNEVPFITNSRITDTGQQINTIEYQDVGIILNVTPHINPDGLVILDVAPEISQLTSSSVPVSAGVTAPVIAKRAALTRVGIRNGNTIVIGGLMEDRKTETVSKVPLLGDLPILGPIFSRTQVHKTKTELLIFLTPHVAPQPDDLGRISGDETSGTKLTPSAVDPGTFDEHLRGMRRGAIPTTKPEGGATTLPIGMSAPALEIPIRPAGRGAPATTNATP